MPSVHKISLSAAILISLNIMVGKGIFVNTAILTQHTGPYSAIVYALIGLIMLPLVLSFAQLLNIHDGGGFYDYVAPIHPLLGFISAFGYFIAKLGSCALGIHVFVVFMQQAIHSLNFFSVLLLDCIMVAFFVMLNMFHVRTGQSIQYGFLGLKVMPVIFVAISGICLFQGSHFNMQIIPIKGVIGSIPLALFAFTGFEACCSLGKNIENSQYNAPRALLVAYILGVCTIVLYQFAFYAALGENLKHMISYTDAFPALVGALLPYAKNAQVVLNFIFPIGIASSALGSAYGIMFSNSWNLFRLANDNLVPFSGTLKKLNKNHVPLFIIIVQGVIVIFYQLLSRGDQVPLQQINSLGVTIAYAISMCALIVHQKKRLNKLEVMPLLGLLACLLLLLSFFYNAFFYGAVPPIIFLTILAGASVVFMIRRPREAKTTQAESQGTVR